MISSLDAVASVREHPRSGHRGGVLEVQLAGGLTFDVLLDRGLDLGAVWWSGNPVAWKSPQAERWTGGDGSRESDWLARWKGGMLTTCGPDNIGPARAGYEMHGSHHGTPADDMQWRREVVGEDVVVTVSGTVTNTEMFGRRVAVYRQIRSSTGRPAIQVTDQIVNVGVSTVAVPLLYHVNFGAPFLSPGSLIQTSAQRTVARDRCLVVPDPSRMPTPTTEMAEAVFEHCDMDADGPLSFATISSPHLEARAVLAWSRASLPRMYQWVWPTRGGWAVGLEPANAPLFGKGRETAHAGAPLIEPGAHVETSVALSFQSTSEASSTGP